MTMLKWFLFELVLGNKAGEFMFDMTASQKLLFTK